MSWGMLIAFILFAAFAAYVHEIIVGIAAMHSGWIPAFAIAFVTLIIGMLIGFPPAALGLLVGFSAGSPVIFWKMRKYTGRFTWHLAVTVPLVERFQRVYTLMVS